MLLTLIWILRVTNWLNWIVTAAFTALLVLLIVDPGEFRADVLGRFGDPRIQHVVMTWLVAVCATVPPVAVAAHLILTRLTAMIRDTQKGEAFSKANAARLTLIAWALLAINLIDLAYGQLSTWASAESGEYFGWSPSLTGWLAVPLLLVLARLFREGAAMRDDLAGTV